MAANEFEKDVRRIMDDLKLHPSEEVWRKVEERIREKKRKRRVIFFLFSLVGLAIVGSLLYVFSHMQNSNPNDSTQNLDRRKTPSSTTSTNQDGVIKTNSGQERTDHQRGSINQEN